ncbi:unnamed protein product (macronuclear) [Paramecium tetraurelia]|uniref:RING-type domain-containing protein n=1 Tax=Paramecium tetraurelia TaxID=5888 RepID=A0DLF5_PARTE|nr:uncharacterized protein GSPATT00018189001 [Paramecium tetraurelia]CAK83872.1 unnamed protein product [Paramecium tetraurelia]|eukprot:XP_001451269.1 hypothetical protein (macronuclear) [Paramecium tetraurelia strain d4-2]
MEELICPQCHNIFNEFENTPLMLPDCGHTICQKCIQYMLSNVDGQQISCPEDKYLFYSNPSILAKGKTHISEFPKNCQLLKMIVKQRPSIEQPEYQLHLNNLAQERIELCAEHLEKLEIVCLTDKIRICTKCALFGNHRHHEVKSVDDVVREVTLRAENIMQTYQRILDKQQEMSESKFYDLLNDKFQTMLLDSQMQVKEKFKELHQQLELKENKLLEQLNGLTQTLEQQTKKQIKDQISSSLQQADLWKIGAKDRLLYFSTKTDNGELPLDLLYNQEFKGNAIIEEMDRTIKMLEQRINNIRIKKIRVDFKKTEIDKCFDTMCSLTLQLNHTENNHVENSFTKFDQEEPLLLRDNSVADWNDIEESLITQVAHNQSHVSTQSVVQAKSPLRTENLAHSHHSITPLKSIKQKSPTKEHSNNTLQPPAPVSILRQGISPTPKLQEKRKKTFKMSEKFDPAFQAFKNDNLEIVDFSNAELGDEGCSIIADQLKICKKVKQLKLARNKISDDGAAVLLQALAQNSNVVSLHLSSNMITERTLDQILTLIKSSQLPRNIYLSQTLINATKSKKKV